MHLLQLLDVVVFQLYKHYHAEALDATTRTGCCEFNKVEFFSSLESIRSQTFKTSTIRSAFRKMGLIPFNPSMVLDNLPSIQLNHEYFEASKTPSPPPESSPSTPKTIRSL